MYAFKRNMESLATGKTHAAGAIVPENLFTPEQLAEMVKVGDIEEVKPTVVKDEVFAPAPAPVAEPVKATEPVEKKQPVLQAKSVKVVAAKKPVKKPAKK